MSEEMTGLNDLNKITEENTKMTWENEIAGQVHELDSGGVKIISWTELHSRLAAKLLHGG